MRDGTPEHVAIVGGGLTGTTALFQLVRDYPVRSITMFECAGEFGPGFPYRRDETNEYLINNTNDTMCLDPGNRRAFFEWLSKHPSWSQGLEAKGHMPRAIYGEFLCDSIDKSLALASEKRIDVRLIEHECIDVEEKEDGRAIVCWEGGSVEVDMVILATGRCPEYDAFGLGDADNYFPSHMRGHRFDDLPDDAEVHVLGASLSAYDVVNQVFSAASGCSFVDEGSDRFRFVPDGNDRKIVLASRSGRLKKCQSMHPRPIERRHFNSAAIAKLDERSASLEQIFTMMQADAELNGFGSGHASPFVSYDDCADQASVNERVIATLEADIDAAMAADGTGNFIVDYLDQAQFDIWDLFAAHKLTASEEKRYRRDFESHLLTYAAPCPVLTAKRIHALMKAGRLRIVHGVRSVREDHDGFLIDHALGTERAGILVNATNSVDRNVDSGRQPVLIRTLVNRGLLQPYRLDGERSNGVAVDMQTFRCKGSRNIYAANMLLWGPGFFTSSAVMMATVIQRLLARAF
jgi:uncharacterized NAD(P)/FAD-binding protein YdhS